MLTKAARKDEPCPSQLSRIVQRPWGIADLKFFSTSAVSSAGYWLLAYVGFTYRLCNDHYVTVLPKSLILHYRVGYYWTWHFQNSGESEDINGCNHGMQHEFALLASSTAKPQKIYSPSVTFLIDQAYVRLCTGCFFFLTLFTHPKKYPNRR